jgi:hypothetical protein
MSLHELDAIRDPRLVAINPSGLGLVLVAVAPTGRHRHLRGARVPYLYLRFF